MFGKRQSFSPPAQTGGRRICLGGFTLTELLVVVAIFAILAMVATPSMGRIVARYRLTAAADELITLMRYGQSEAKMRGQTVNLSISDNTLTVQSGTEALRQIEISSRLTLKPTDSVTNGSIAFLSNGQIRPAGGIQGRVSEHGRAVEERRGMLLLCSSSLPTAGANDINAIAIGFFGSELRRQEHNAGATCDTFPSWN